LVFTFQKEVAMRRKIVVPIVMVVLSLAIYLPGNFTLSQGEKNAGAVGAIYWKGNLHTHSLWSDGNDYPDMIADWYKTHGYQFLALTEHNLLAEGEKWATPKKAEGNKGKALEKYVNRFGPTWVEKKMVDGKELVRLKTLEECKKLHEEQGKFLFVPAEEITHKFAKFPIHMNALNVNKAIKPVDGEGIRETMTVNLRNLEEQSKKSGNVTLGFLNHPNFQQSIPAEDIAMCSEIRFFEVHNGHSGVRNYGGDTFPSCEKLWDVALALRLGKLKMPLVYGLATDDSHEYHDIGLGKTNPGRGWVMVRSKQLNPDSLLQAMHKGDFYSSTGVVLDDVIASDGELIVKIKAEAGVSYRTEFIVTYADTSLDSTPVLDKDGKAVMVTRNYAGKIGVVAKDSTETTAKYKFTGRELYVRAKVVSSKLHPNPYQKGDFETAWVQPVVPASK